MKALVPAKPTDVQEWKPCIEAFADMVAAQAEIIGLFRDLQQRVILALDAADLTGETVHLTVPEIAKYILGPKIHKESAASSDRLIRKWISDGKLIVTKIKHGLYAVRAAHLEILKVTNR